MTTNTPWSEVTSGDLKGYFRHLEGYYLSVVQAPDGLKKWYGSFDHQGYPGAFDSKKQAMQACEREARSSAKAAKRGSK